MDSKTLTKFHRFGAVGRIIMTVLLAVAVAVTVLCLAATVYLVTLPKNAMTVQVTDQAEFRIQEKNFDSLWGFLANKFAYEGSEDAKKILGNGKEALTPSEGQEIQTELSFLNQSYASARITSEGDVKVIKAQSAPDSYRGTDLTAIMFFYTLLAASTTVAVYILRRLFGILAVCETPFCNELVKRLKEFGVALLPAALFASVAETLSRAFLTAGKESGIQIQWGVLVAFAVTMCLVTVFRYGVLLQKESDETL